MNHSFTFHPSLSPLYTRIPHDDPIDSQSQHSAHALAHEERTLPHVTRKVPPKGEWTSPGRSRDVQRHRERTVHRPVSRMAASQHSFIPDVLSNHCQMAPSLRTPHYTTGCSLSPHATSHSMIVPSRRPGASEAAGRDALRDCREVLGEMAPSAACHTTRPAVPNRIIDFCHRPTCALRGTRHSGCEDSSPSV